MEVQVFTREEDVYRLDFDIRKEIVNGIPVNLINLPREKDGYEHPKLNAAFRTIVNDFDPDIIHIGHLNHLSLGIVNECKRAGKPVIYTLHDFWLMCPRGQFLQRNFDGQNQYKLCEGQEHKKCATNCYKMIHSCRPEDTTVDNDYWENWIERRMKSVEDLIPLIDYFIAPSNYLMNRFVNDFKLDKNKVEYLDYGFPTHYLKPVEDTETRTFTFGYIGTHIPSKGVDLLIKAFSKVESPSRLIIWGRSHGQSTIALKALAKKSIQPIEFRGEYENPNIRKEVFKNVNAIVVPSIWGENSPLVIHEAQFCRVPVITANFGGMKEYVQHEVNGLLFTHRDVDDLFSKLAWAIDHQKEMKTFGKRGYLYSENGDVISIKEHCQSLTEIYNSAINTNENNQERTLENHN